MHIACEQGDLDCVMALIVPITQNEIAEAAIVNYPIGIQSVPMDVMQIRNYEGEKCGTFYLHLLFAAGEMISNERTRKVQLH